MIISAAIAVAIGLVVGFVSGGLIYRQSRRWCPQCGAFTEDLRR
ncbi:hypothetical protein ACNTMW_31240 [Planosporangium sp. 12N6]